MSWGACAAVTSLQQSQACVRGAAWSQCDGTGRRRVKSPDLQCTAWRGHTA